MSTTANVSCSARDLNKNHSAMSYMGMPYGPDCYFPRKVAVDRMLDDVRDVPEDQIQRMVMTHAFRYVHSYWNPTKPEEDYTRKNLNDIMELVHLGIQDTLRANIAVKSGKDLHDYFNYHLCSTGSLGEPAVVYGRGTLNGSDSLKCGLCASEAKGVFAGAGEALAQGVGMAAEMAADQASKGIKAEDILVPFILVFGESVQFGAVFVIDQTSFPCPMFLSTTLSLMSWEGREQVKTVQLAGQSFLFYIVFI
jgi:hypothetical protein